MTEGLLQKIVRIIETSGPMSVAHFMAICLLDPEDGYYTTRQPFGSSGDFTTAPEISQMFGELVAIWLYSTWQELGAPERVTIGEIGPGRGTMFADMVRTFEKLDPALVAKADFALIEASPRLRDIQKQALAKFDVSPVWHDTVSSLAPQPLLLAGNEIFDALPIRQFVKTRTGWHERCIALTENRTLQFIAGAAQLDASLLPPETEKVPAGTIVEVSPARQTMMHDISLVLARNCGAALFFDYGYLQSSTGDTLQAVRDHRPADVLSFPGCADMTAHVDFASLARTLMESELESHVCEQGFFLNAMGLVERSENLGRGGDKALRARLRSQVERLADPRHMGELFKVFAIVPRGTSVHPFNLTH